MKQEAEGVFLSSRPVFSTFSNAYHVLDRRALYRHKLSNESLFQMCLLLYLSPCKMGTSVAVCHTYSSRILPFDYLQSLGSDPCEQQESFSRCRFLDCRLGLAGDSGRRTSTLVAKLKQLKTPFNEQMSFCSAFISGFIEPVLVWHLKEYHLQTSLHATNWDILELIGDIGFRRLKTQM
jgi:hypothetical protein